VPARELKKMLSGFTDIGSTPVLGDVCSRFAHELLNRQDWYPTKRIEALFKHSSDSMIAYEQPSFV
jgi:hypothetical protein